MHYPMTAGTRPALFSLVLLFAFSAQAATLTVDTTDDEFDSTPNATCSLREAVESSNLDADFGGCTADGGYGADTILLPAGTYALTRTPAEEFLALDNSVGDLDIGSNTVFTAAQRVDTPRTRGGAPSDSVSIVGEDRETTIIERPGNAADEFGIIDSVATLNLEDLTVRGGQTVAGAGIFADIDLSLKRVIVQDNLARAVDAGGGGIVVFGALTLIDSVITENRVELVEPCDFGPESTGGGVLAFVVSESLIQRSTISNNTVAAPSECAGFGGGLGVVRDGAAPLRILNSTISGNSAPFAGGADLFLTPFLIGLQSETSKARVRSSRSSVADTSRWFDRQAQETESRGVVAGASLEHVTITDNSADEVGGLSLLDSGETSTARIENSLIAGNSAGVAPDCSRFGVAVDDGGVNLLGIDEPLPADSVCLTSLPNIIGSTGAPVDPGLMPLADNSGLTPTHAIVSGSAALDAAPDTGVAEDQRNVTRPQGSNFDIGAFETIQTDIAVTKTASGLPAVPGTGISYEVSVSNLGPSDDPAVTLDDALPPQLDNCSYTSAASGGASGNTTPGSGDLVETLGMPSGSSVVYSITCDIDSAATGQLANTAEADASEIDSDSTNNTATDSTSLQPQADIAITKTVGATTIQPGDTINYRIVVRNLGPSDDPSVTITDQFPAALTECAFTSTATDGATGNSASGNGDLLENVSLPVGSSVRYEATCTVPESIRTSMLSNTATAAASVIDTEASNDSATASNTQVLLPVPALNHRALVVLALILLAAPLLLRRAIG